MAIQKNIADVKLRLKLQSGTTNTGTAILKNLNYNSISNDATDEDLYAAAEAVASLQSKPLDSVQTVVVSDLSSEE